MFGRAWLVVWLAAWCGAGPGPPGAPAAGAERLFAQSRYNVSVPENSPPRTLVLPAAGAAVPGARLPAGATRCRYRVRHGDRDKFFKAEERALGDRCLLLLRTRATADVLNRERRDLYLLTVRVTVVLHDGSALDDDAEVAVRVTDVNDLSPLFYPTEYTATVREDAPLHTSVARVTAEDADLGLNGEIYYSFVTPEERFAVHPVTGVVTLTRPLQAGDSPLRLELLARDRASLLALGDAAPAARATLAVTVTRANLHAPALSVLHLADAGGAAAGDVYAAVEATDADEGDRVTALDIVDGDPDGHFRVLRAGAGRWHVALHALLPRDAPLRYNLTLRARDAGRPPRHAYAALPVELPAARDAAPVFSRELYEASVAEWAPPRTPLVRLKVAARGAGGDVTLEIVGGNEGGEFTVDANSGVLATAVPLDAERRALYTLTVAALDRGAGPARRQSSAKVKITVLDCNDNDPVFEQDDLEVTIAENGPAGTVVARLAARDADSGENAYISYSIANPEPVPFEIDHFSGVVRTTRVLDYESMRREWELRVRASDWGLPFRRQAEARLAVRLRDVNDNRPQFERVDCVVHVPRALPAGAALLALAALDLDAGDAVAYRIAGGNDDGCFALDAATGVLRAACELRDVRPDVRVLNVTATDGAHFADDAAVTLRLAGGAAGVSAEPECRDTGAVRRRDELQAAAARAAPQPPAPPAPLLPGNLHTPDFIDFPVEIKVNESVSLGTSLVRIRAHDRDAGYGGLLVYAISGGDTDSAFRIDPDTGELKVIGYLDREREAEYYLNVTVADLGSPPRARSRLLPVTVLDVNDHAPRFERALASLRVTESALNGTVVFAANATDADAGEFGRVTYSLSGGGGDFCVEREAGRVRVCGALDRERRALYELRVRATDGGGRAGEAAVRVAVDDVNDEAPRWPALQAVRVREDLPRGSLLAALHATDRDLAAGGAVRYSLPDAPSDDTFSIDAISGVLRTNKMLDFEQRQTYSVSVRACDGGVPALCADAALAVEVEDVDENAHAPQFPERVLRAAVREAGAAGAAVARVAAVDADARGPNSRLAYYILDGDGMPHFTVDDTGEIHTLTPLDREVKAFYWLTVCAHDHGLIPQHACIQVFIEVEDVNDNAPWPESALVTAAVDERAPAGTPVAVVRATDDDAAPTNISYTIVAGNPDGLFSIDEHTGEIVTTGRTLDRTLSSTHLLEVACSDGALATSARVRVNVRDVNDRAPVFTQRYYDFKLPLPDNYTDDVQNESSAAEENSVESDDEGEDDSRWDYFEDDRDAPPLYVATVCALDSDAGANGSVRYSARARPRLAARVHARSGRLYAARPLAALTLTVRACDSGSPPLCSVARVRVRSAAAGSGGPPALAAPPPLAVAELDAPGFLLTVLQAVDNEGDAVYYDIIDGDPLHEFHVGRSDGSVLLARRLRWERAARYTLTVTASDGRSSSTARLHVTVVNDVNEGGVAFEQEEYVVKVPAQAPPGTDLLRLVATVRGVAGEGSPGQAGEGGELLYGVAAWRAPASAALFRLHERTATLQLARPLQQEYATEHEVTVWARDQAPRASLAFARVRIAVERADLHAPHWGRRLAHAAVPLASPPGALVALLRAADRDGDPLSYSLRGGGGLFSVDDTGTVRLTRTIPEDSRELSLVVRATGPPPASRVASLPLRVLVSSAPPAKPRPARSHVELLVEENGVVGAVLGTLELRGGAAGARWSLAGNGAELFALGPTCGTLLAAAPLDYETQTLYNLTATVTNMAGLSADVDITVHVIDRNEFPPTLAQREYFGELSELAAAGALARDARGQPLVLAASDGDGPAQRRRAYRILEPDAARLFRLHAATGALTLAAPLDYETAREHEFTVRVLDNGSPRLPPVAASDARVTIKVLDEDDAAPAWEQPAYSATVLLPSAEGVLVAEPRAFDPDTPPERLTFDIMEGDAAGAFKIDATGRVFVAKPSLLAAHAALRLRVADGRRAGTTRLAVDARGPRAAGLQFARPAVAAAAAENTTRVATVAVLPVLGAALNEHVHFSILNPTPEFEIGATSGAVRTTGVALDREARANYALLVLARSGPLAAPREALAELTISVADVNDNCPVFLGRPLAAAARAGEAPQLLLTLHAVDADAGDNADVRYEMKRGHAELFRVDRRSGELSLRQPLDARDEPYELTVAAFDGGSPACGTEAVVSVRVAGGGAGPRWAAAAATLEAAEGAPLPSLPPASSPLGRPLLYELLDTPDKQYFRLHYDTGVLEPRELLDYEARREYALVVRAADSVSGARAELALAVRVRDVNDAAPAFPRAVSRAALSEAARAGASVAVMAATDADSGDNGRITYSLSSDEPASLQAFSIDETTGEVRVAAALDRETIAEHLLVVEARDNGRPARWSRAALRVSLTDVNDNPPQVSRGVAALAVSARAPRGLALGRVAAWDADVGDTLTFAAEGDPGAVSVDPDGTVRVARRWTGGPRSINVSVSDGAHAAWTRVKLTPAWPRRAPPRFPHAVHEARVMEAVPPPLLVATVKAFESVEDGSDSDSTAVSSGMRYSLPSARQREVFSLDAVTGALSTRVPLDREAAPYWEVGVLATDSLGLVRAGSVRVLVGDADEHAPRFPLREYCGCARGAAAPVLRARAVDRDAAHQRLTYALAGGAQAASLRVDAGSGELWLAAPAPRGSLQAWLTAAGGGKTDEVPVRVYVLEEGEAAPTVTGPEVIQVSEDAAVGSLLCALRGSPGARLRLAAADRAPPVALDAAGRLALAAPLDRETIPEYTIGIIAELPDSGACSMLQLRLQVLDVNEHAPAFHSQPYVLALSEAAPAGTTLLTLMADDPDGGANGEVTFSLAEDADAATRAAFSVDDAGHVVLRAPLDRETRAEWRLPLAAADGARPARHSRGSLLLRLLDDNDSPHSFVAPQPVAILEDSTIGTLITKLAVRDPDASPPPLTYWVVSGDDSARFTLRGPDLILARPLDRETTDAYHLRLAASDGQFTAYTDLDVTVLDVNDNAPECSAPRVAARVSEGAALGARVASLAARDADVGENARVRYSLQGEDSQHFRINEDTGEITVAAALDRESRDLYSLTATAADAARTAWNCSAAVTVRVDDVNDNDPTFSQRVYSVTLPEDAELGTLVVKVHATDGDLGAAGDVRYEIALDGDADGGSVFALDSASGAVTLRAPLDRETRAEHRLSLLARDGGSPARTAAAALRLTVADVNDNPPEFETREYRVSVPELAAPQAELLRVRALSRDAGDNARVHYALLAGDARADFELDRDTGALTVRRPLDYERRREYLLTVQAVDAGEPPLSDVATVNVTVLDGNDNAPVFGQAVYVARIREDATVGAHVATVTADDADSGENGRVEYSIARGDPDGRFAVDPRTGAVTLAAPLDRERVAAYTLQLRARDAGVPALVAGAELRVEVGDANDNAPRLALAELSAVVREDWPLGRAVLRLEVSDPDAPPNAAPFTFDLLAGNDRGAFRVEADGTLRTAARFNRRLRERYDLTVRVFDNGAPPLYSDATVRVRVVEQSQYPPVVTPLDVLVVSHNDEFPGGAVGRVFASDRDAYDTLTFSLAPADGAQPTAALFSLDAGGELSAAPRLDVGDYRLNVTVDDGKFTGHALVRVSVVLVTDEMLAQAVVVRFREVSDRDFVLGHRKGFLRAVAEATDCEPSDVIIVSVQPAGEAGLHPDETDEDNETDQDDYVEEGAGNMRARRQVARDLDVAFAVRAGAGLLPADALRRRLHAHLERLEERARLVVEELRRAACAGCERGACAERVALRRGPARVVSSDVFALCAPAHRLRAWCACPAGWAGARCERRAACGSAGCGGRALRLRGDGYVQLAAPRAGLAGRRVPADELELSLRLRTRRARGVLLAAAGRTEHLLLALEDGVVTLRLDVGGGELRLAAGARVDDGAWHAVRLARAGAAARLAVDRRAAAGAAPGEQRALDAPGDRLLLGAALEAHEHADAQEQITYGFDGCLADVMLGGVPVPLEEGAGGAAGAAGEPGAATVLRRVRARMQAACGELPAPDACGGYPCQHGGACRVTEAGYSCACLPRYSGAHCELDSAPCASRPCLHGGTCVEAGGTYRCLCSTGLSGPRCERGRWCGADGAGGSGDGGACLHGGACEDGAVGPQCACRGYWGARCELDVDECAGEPCLNGATCINEPGSFRCLCPPDKTGMNCGNPLYSDAVTAGGGGAPWWAAAWRWAASRWPLLAALCSALLLLSLLPLLCRRRAPPAATPVKPPPPKLSNLTAAARRERPASAGAPLNNADTLRSYGSAGDELELPRDYRRNLNLNVAEPDRKPWSEQMHLHTFVDNKIYNDLKGGKVAARPPLGPGGPLAEPRLVGGYHWDCSDWCGAPLDVPDLPHSERRDSSSPPPDAPRPAPALPALPDLPDLSSGDELPDASTYLLHPDAYLPVAGVSRGASLESLRGRSRRAPDAHAAHAHAAHAHAAHAHAVHAHARAGSVISMMEERDSLLGGASSSTSAALCEIEDSDDDEAGGDGGGAGGGGARGTDV